jgi:RNA polymerase primary sigma factor
MTKEQDKLVTDNMGYVVTLARQYQQELQRLKNQGLSFVLSVDDLVSEGSIGLMKAAQKYDAQCGKPFVTFAAPYIRRSIETAIHRMDTESDIRSTDESLPVGSRNNYTLLNVLEDTNAPKTDAALEQSTLSDDLIQTMVVLNAREQAVIQRFFGIGAERQTMAEIGTALDLKRERVRQIRDQAVRKMRKEAKKEIEL